MSDIVDEIISTPSAPAYLPPNVKEARNFIHWGSIFFLIAGVVWILWGIWDLIWVVVWSASWYWVGYFWAGAILSAIIRIALGFIAIILRTKVRKSLIGAIDSGRYVEATNKAVIYAILGFIFAWVIGGILILLGYFKLKETPAAAPVGPPAAAPSSPGSPPGTAPPQVSPPPHPTNCPTCGKPARFVGEMQKWYCDVCQKYL
ncbi:MAG: hypothetical protein ACE5KV_05340 [Thermoplasmata archaeon]